MRGLLPDGLYRLKVVASDAPSHNPGEALTGGAGERPVPDRHDAAGGHRAGGELVNGKIHVALTATDARLRFRHAEYSVDAGPWQYVEPVGKLSDSLTEQFEFEAPLNPPQPGRCAPVNPTEHVITVRVYDRVENAAAVKAVVR